MRRITAVLFVIIYVCILTLDIFGILPDISQFLKFAGVALCFVASINSGTKTCLALALTLVADFFLVFNINYIVGILIFCAAQTVRIADFVNIRAAVIMASIAMTLGIVAYIINLDMIICVSAAYSVLLISAALAAFIKRNIYDKVGMVLFICCDVNVAALNICGGDIFVVLIWLFYLPSQMLLAGAINMGYRSSK